jgi:hypothetical protein
MGDAMCETFTALYNAVGGIGSGAIIPLSLRNAMLREHPPMQQKAILLRRWLLEVVPIFGSKDIPTTILCAAMAGFCRLVIDLVLIIVGEFLTRLNVPDRYNPDGVAELFRVAVGVTRMIDIACRILGHTAINGISLIQSEDIGVACG